MPDPFFAASPADIPDRDTILSLSGLDFMQRVVDGTLPQAPMARAMNFRLAEVAHGRAVFHGAPLFEHMNPMGAVHGGWYGTLLDSCMGCAVMTALPQGRVYTTLEYKANLLRAIPRRNGRHRHRHRHPCRPLHRRGQRRDPRRRDRPPLRLRHHDLHHHGC
jgi:uncharacterized protein (TIGR00369 family)